MYSRLPFFYQGFCFFRHVQKILSIEVSDLRFRWAFPEHPRGKTIRVALATGRAALEADAPIWFLIDGTNGGDVAVQWLGGIQKFVSRHDV